MNQNPVAQRLANLERYLVSFQLEVQELHRFLKMNRAQITGNCENAINLSSKAQNFAESPKYQDIKMSLAEMQYLCGWNPVSDQDPKISGDAEKTAINKT